MKYVNSIKKKKKIKKEAERVSKAERKTIIPPHSGHYIHAPTQDEILQMKNTSPKLREELVAKERQLSFWRDPNLLEQQKRFSILLPVAFAVSAVIGVLAMIMFIRFMMTNKGIHTVWYPVTFVLVFVTALLVVFTLDFAYKQYTMRKRKELERQYKKQFPNHNCTDDQNQISQRFYAVTEYTGREYDTPPDKVVAFTLSYCTVCGEKERETLLIRKFKPRHDNVCDVQKEKEAYIQELEIKGYMNWSAFILRVGSQSDARIVEYLLFQLARPDCEQEI